MNLSFFVPGIPAPGGSKRFVGFGKKTGRAILIDDAGQRNKNWRAVVAESGLGALKAIPGTLLFHGPLKVEMTFSMPRPKGHKTPKGELRKSAPQWPTTKPDALKLARSTEDALTGVVWHDDAQTAILHITKRFAAADEACGCYINITSL